MNDSILIHKFIEITIRQDSTFRHIEHIESVANDLKNESLLLKLLPLIGVIIGGLITWLIQKSIKEKELKLTVFREVKDATTKITSSLTNLQFHLNELAYLEVDSKYQLHLSQTTFGNEQKRALEEHYHDYKYIAEVKSKVSNCVAEIISNFASYYKLKNSDAPNETSIKLTNFTNHILALQREVEFPLSVDLTTEDLKNKIDKLSQEYNKNIKDVKELVDYL